MIRGLFKKYWQVLLILALAYSVRFYFFDKFINVSGDLLLYADWGEKYWEYGRKNFYFVKDWYYAPPNYPPLINLYYAYAYKVFDYKYLFAELHNLIKIPPAVFIVFYYKYGYYINLKILGIISDLLLGLLIYVTVYRLSKKTTSAAAACIFFLFNPIGIILSSVWGQTDSVIALLSLSSFILLTKKKFVLSTILMVLGLTFKPNWIIFIPLYVYIFIRNKPKAGILALSLISALFIIVVTSLPFSDNPFNFIAWLVNTRIIPTITNTPKLSVSAFNFYTIFYSIDYHLLSQKLAGVPVGYIGRVLFMLIYVQALAYLKKSELKDIDIYKVIISVGLGCFIFMPGMLERYFFPAIIPLVIIASLRNRKILILYLTFTLTFSLNLIWALFRRKYGVINEMFVGSEYLLIRIISIHNVFGYFIMLSLIFEDNLLKLNWWRTIRNILIQPMK